MTRKESTELRNASIPGKYEGAPCYAPYFWEKIMEGDGCEIYEPADHDDTYYYGTAIQIDEETGNIWPEIADEIAVFIPYNDTGFIDAIPFSELVDDKLKNLIRTEL